MHRRSRFAAYAEVLGDPAARAFSITGFVARLPQSTTGIGIVLLVSLTSGSLWWCRSRAAGPWP